MKVRRIRIQPDIGFKKAIRRVSLKSGGWISRVTGLLLKGHLYGLLGVVYTLSLAEEKKIKVNTDDKVLVFGMTETPGV